MRVSRLICGWLLVCGLALAADRPSTPALPCGPGMPGCAPTKAELKRAHTAYERGLKLDHADQYEAALSEFEEASRLNPHSAEYASTYQLARQQAAMERMQAAHRDTQAGRQVEAQANYRAALSFDPDNSLAQLQLKQALGGSKADSPVKAEVVEDSPVIVVVPNNVKADFHFTGDSKALLVQVAAAYGVTATVDDALQGKRVRFDISNVNFAGAMNAASYVTKTFWTPLEAKQVFVAANTPDNHKQFDHLAMRTFYFPGLSQNTALNDVVNVLRVVLEARFVVPSTQTGKIVVRAPQNVIDAATRLLTNYGENRPQVMFDISVVEVSSTLMRSLGVHLPNQFNIYNIPIAALGGIGGANIQDLINQLISGGGINQLGNQSISSLLSQLTGQQSNVFSQPLATFGNGLGLTGVSLNTLSGTASLNSSMISTLEHATMRAAQGDSATLHFGTRYPILNASFAPVFNTPAIAQNIAGNSLQAPFPSFNYEDLGLVVKAKPSINSAGSVSLDLEMQLRALGSTSLNGVPVISSREFKGSIAVADGEPAVIAGSVSQTDIRSLSGIPGLGQLPGLNRATTTNSLEHDEDQLLVVITPHVLSTPDQASAEVWLTP